MPQVDDQIIYEIKDYQTAGGQEILNVWHYRGTGLYNPVAEIVATAFATDVITQILTTQNTGVVHTSVEVTELTSVSNFFTLSLSGYTGGVTGSNMAQFLAYSLRMVRTTRDTRGGWKRIVGLIEENVTGGTFTAGFLSDIDDVAAAAADFLAVGIGSLTPIILSKRYSELPVRELLPVDEWYFNDVSNVLAINRITTQNSRKAF